MRWNAAASAWIAIAIVVASSSGCQSWQARRDAMLDAVAAETSCPRSELSTRRLLDRIYRISGCGTYVDYAEQFAVSPIAGYQGHPVYHHWLPVPGIREVAPTELSCLEGTLDYAQRSPTYYDVTGCGRGAAFELQCGGLVCSWIRGEISRAR